jgi:hypothetical protein
VADARLPEPEKIVGQLMVLVEGAIVTAYVEGDYGAARRAKEMAEVLLRQVTVH